VSPGHRRDVLLHSGAVTELAHDIALLNEYLTGLGLNYEAAIWIPTVVMSEVRTGDPRKDVAVDRLIKLITRAGGGRVPVSDAAIDRGGVLRTEVLKARNAKALEGQSKADISGIDGILVGDAEERSLTGAVTILTGDLKDIQDLVIRTRRPNIAVVKVS
jgi:hypothetical protein